MDKRTKQFWAGSDMEPWQKLEQDGTKADLMKISGHAREGEKASLLREAIRLCTSPN